MVFIKWVLALCVYVFVLLFNLKVVFYSPALYLSLLVTGSVVIFLGLWFFVKSRQTKEAALAKPLSPL